MSASPSSASLSAASCVTGADGTCAVTLTSAASGVVTITASAPIDASDSATGSTSITFRGPWTVSPTGSSNAIAIGSSGSNITVTVNGATEARPASTVTAINVTGMGTTSLAVGATASRWALSSGAAGTVTAAGLPSIAFSNVSSISASGASNTLAGPAADATWTLTGQNSGEVAGLAFSGFQNLTGAANNKDTFVVSTGGALSGQIDGGAGGFDTLVISGSHTSVSSTANSASSGTITADGKVIVYAGLEPITIVPSTAPTSPPLASVQINGSAGNDHITIRNDTAVVGNLVASAPTMESISFPVPTSTLTIDGGDGDDEVTLAGTLTFSGLAFLVRAERISVGAGTVITNPGGTISLQAANDQTGTALSGLVNATGSASATVTDATLSAGSIAISAASTVAPPSPSSKFIGLHADSMATVSVGGASLINASGGVSLTASSTVTAPMNAVASPGDGTPGADVAVAGALVSSTATVSVAGATSGFTIAIQASNQASVVSLVGSIASPRSTATSRRRNSFSAARRLPCTVAVTVLLPARYRNSNAPGERWRIWPVIGCPFELPTKCTSSRRV